MPVETHVELELVRHITNCLIWLVEQRDWGNATTVGAIENFVWENAAEEEFMRDVPRELHAAAFLELRMEFGDPAIAANLASLAS